MVRIFVTLAVFAVLLLVSNLIVGLALGDLGASTQRYADAVRQHESLARSESATNAEVRAANETRQQALQQLVAMRGRFRPHIWLGIASALVAILVNCISVTYFVGTSRWCREVVEAYGLDWQLAEESRRLKRRSFPIAVCGMLTIVGIVALGGAADPGGSANQAAGWVMPHYLAAMAGIAFVAFAYYFQAQAVAANYRVIQTIMAAAQALRTGDQPAASS